MRNTCCLVMLLAGAPAFAAETSSAYTKIDVRRDCKHQSSNVVEDYGDWRCKGYAGFPMWFGAGDQRMFVSFGARAKDEPAAEQTLAPFNDFYKGTIEWRLADGKPFATIIRWNAKLASDMENRKTRGRVLVVTRLPPGPVCHGGYVDALANPDANALARDIADRLARGFTCGKDKAAFAGKLTPGESFIYP